MPKVTSYTYQNKLQLKKKYRKKWSVSFESVFTLQRIKQRKKDINQQQQQIEKAITNMLHFQLTIHRENRGVIRGANQIIVSKWMTMWRILICMICYLYSIFISFLFHNFFFFFFVIVIWTKNTTELNKNISRKVNFVLC